MRIAFDHQIFSFQEYGGVSRYIYELAAEFARTFGDDVAIIAPLYVNRYLEGAPDNLNVMGMSVPRLSRSDQFYLATNSLLSWPALRSFRPDIVHETYYSPRRIAPHRARVILTVHDMIHEKLSGHFPIGDLTSKHKALSVGRADHVICVSEQTRRDLIELLDLDPARTSVVHHGFTSRSSTESAQKRDPQMRPFLLYVGRRSGHKNFDRLLQAFAASPLLKKDFDLVCFGGGPFTFEERSLLQRLRLPDQRCCHVSGDDGVLAGLYRSACAFVYPSLYEGFGIPPLEAMRFDCPVVSSGVSSIPEVVGDAAELFDPYDPDSIQRAIERVVTDEGLREALVSRGRERIKQFSWERCAKETMDVYTKVLS